MNTLKFNVHMVKFSTLSLFGYFGSLVFFSNTWFTPTLASSPISSASNQNNAVAPCRRRQYWSWLEVFCETELNNWCVKTSFNCEEGHLTSQLFHSDDAFSAFHARELTRTPHRKNTELVCRNAEMPKSRKDMHDWNDIHTGCMLIKNLSWWKIR